MLSHHRERFATTITTSILVLVLGGLAACSSSDEPADGSGGPTNEDGEAPLSDLDDLLTGAPTKADALPEEGKADAVYPEQFTDLVALNSPVKSQGSRGVCSIFSTVAYMEHLYISEGTFKDPDFSEQFLQWSVKNEVKAFQTSDGSNAQQNLQAINRFGIVTEREWAYESYPWSTTHDPTCTGEDRPTYCYTNGEPPAAALQAERWRLPVGRWINSSERSLKAHMYTKKQAVVVGGTFFYQSWNHRRSALPVSNEYWRDGYVTYPNEADKEASLKQRAGHGFLLVGWDDNLQVPKRDGEGKTIVDAQGNPEMEKGFFIFKNSWGTGSFGARNPHGEGYGFISYQYASEYLTAYVSGLPEVATPDEVCNDGKDNDRDNAVDCEDTDCAAAAACAGSTKEYANTQGGNIPDNNPQGLESTIVVSDGGKISAVAVTVDITHSYSGDLTVKLVREGGGEVVLQSRQGASDDDIKKTFTVNDFNGQDAAGRWKLVVVDSANLDAGRLNSWRLSISTCIGDDCGGGPQSYASTESKAIPDGDPTGVFTNVVVGDGGAIGAMKVNVDITHPEQTDLAIKLQRVGTPGEVVLQESASASGAFVPRSYDVADYVGQDAAGTWRLVVIDEASGDAGTLNGWSLDISR